MGKYFKASDYYPDDKDIYDFLDSQTRSIEPIASFLRSRYVFVSKEDDKEHLQVYSSLLYFDWPSANKLVDTVNIREVEQKVCHSKICVDTGIEVVKSAIQAVKDGRDCSKREVYQIRQNSNDTIEIDVTYLDIDTSKTRVLQKREKDLQIVASKNGEEWCFRYTDNDRSKTIVKEIKEKLLTEIQLDTCTEKIIDLSHIRDHSVRVDFFKKMMTEIEGFRFLGASTIKVDRLPRETQPQNDDDDDIDQEEQIIELENRLKKVIMYGQDLFTVREFQELVRDGFFISSSQWKSQKRDGNPEVIEFSAGFNNSPEGKDFYYKVLGVYKLDDGGNLKKVREKVFGLERDTYLSALEKNAYNALISVENTANEHDS